MKGKVRVSTLTHERLLEVLDYNPETGAFVWKKPTSRSVKPGQKAGSRNNAQGYVYLVVDGETFTSSRLAWFYMKGEWPDRRVRFVNGDVSDCRFDNLTLFNGLAGEFDHKTAEGRREYHRRYRQASPEVFRAAELRRNFGISLAEYGEMLLAQNGVCAICEKPEWHTREGKLKALAVDHNHETGEVRGLLCVDCNTGIGKLREDRNILLAAVRYLDKHSDKSTVVTLNSKGNG